MMMRIQCGIYKNRMSFQSFSKLPPPPKNRPKNLPSPDLITTLSSLCEDTPNSYDSRTHVLSICDQAVFANNLMQRGRSVESFGKQLRFVGFRKQKEVLGGQQDRVIVRYVWRGRREDYISKQLEFTERHLQAMLARAADLRAALFEKKGKLDLQFEQGIFWGMIRGGEISRLKVDEAVVSAKETVNFAHKLSAEIARDIEVNLQNEVSLLRLLAYKNHDSEHPQP